MVSFPIEPLVRARASRNIADFYASTFSAVWKILVLCEPLSVVVAYEQRRGIIYGDPYARGELGLSPFDVFCKAWLALYAWINEAKARRIYANKMHVICMDRIGYPQRFGIPDYEARMQDVEDLISAADCEWLLRDERIAPYIHWMRDNREIFEFVDRVGCYGSEWWLDY